MKQRLQYLDSIKGFAIFLMVLAHTIAWQFEDYRQVVLIHDGMSPNVLTAGFIWQFIYSFHMPLFFMVSGYLQYKPNMSMGGVLIGIKKRTTRLLIPYFVTGFLITILRPGFGYWFLFSLWELAIIGALLQLFLQIINKRNILVIDIIVILFVWKLLEHTLTINTLTNPVVDIGKGVRYFLPFMLGWLLNKYRTIDDFLSNCYSFIMLFFIFLFSIRYIHVEFRFYEYFNKIVNLLPLIPILGSLTFFYLFKQGVSRKLQDAFAWLGQQTFEIYILHIFFVMRIIEVGNFWLGTNLPTCLASQLIYSLIVSIIAIGISIIIARFIKHNTVLSKFMFGQ